MVPFHSIYIKNDEICEINKCRPRGETALKKNYQRISCRGMFVIPGMIDSHIHLAHGYRGIEISALHSMGEYLKCGITSIRCVGDDIYSQRLVRDAVDLSVIAGPHIYLASPFVEGRNPYHKDGSYSARSRKDIQRLLDLCLKHKVTTVKIYGGTRTALGRYLVTEAKKLNLKITAHLQWGYTVQDALNDGIDCIEHTESMLEFILPKGSPKWPELHLRKNIAKTKLEKIQRELLRIKSELRITDLKVDSLVNQFARTQTALVPTLVVYKNWVLLRDKISNATRVHLKHVPQHVAKEWSKTVAMSPYPKGTLNYRRKQYKFLEILTKKLYEMGVSLGVGTDSPVPRCVPGYAFHEELKLLKDAGLPGPAILKAATRGGASLIGENGKRGCLTVGAFADMVICYKNPIEDIENAKCIQSVYKSGRLVHVDNG